MTLGLTETLTVCGIVFNGGILVGTFYALKTKVEDIKNDLKEDISRLEKKTEEGSNVKERLAIQEATDKMEHEALWRRIDELRGWKK